jgi:hypothetical protein
MSVQPQGLQPELPYGIDRRQHADRDRTPWPRRAAITVLAVFCLLALLNTFGQVSAVRSADSPAASLTVDSPERLRGGLIFTTVITVVAHQQIKDARLVLSPGWFNGMTLNAAAPQSSQESSSEQGGIFDYGQLDAGSTTPIWISWQANPTTAGGRSQDVQIFDGDKPVVGVHRSVFVFP